MPPIARLTVAPTKRKPQIQEDIRIERPSSDSSHSADWSQRSLGTACVQELRKEKNDRHLFQHPKKVACPPLGSRFFQSCQHALRCKRSFAQAHTGGVADRVGDRRWGPYRS